jgi:hypothetical protein
MSSSKNPIFSFLSRLTANMRFPYLFLLTASLFVIDLFIPDAIPMFDEIFLALSTLLLASLKKKVRKRDGSDSGEQD